VRPEVQLANVCGLPPGSFIEKTAPLGEAAVTPRLNGVMLDITEVRANPATTVKAERPEPLRTATAKRVLGEST